jgi:transposase
VNREVHAPFCESLGVQLPGATHHGSGFWLLTKRLETDRFIWPDRKAEIVTMTPDLLHALLEGDDISTIQRHPKREYLRVS